jgi:hypothetical protein
MELKDVILSTLAEMEDDAPIEELSTASPIVEESLDIEPEYETEDETQVDSELVYLNSIRERLLVLFEGFQAPNNANIEAKVDMTLNFLEYTLATIDLRVQTLEKGSSKLVNTVF